MSKWRRLAAAGAAVAFGAALAACTSNSDDGSASSTSTTGNVGSGSTPSTGVQPSTTVPDSVLNQVSVRKNVDMQNCGSAPGGWSAGGTVKNKLGHAATYHITVFFTTGQATDLAYGVTSVQLASGQGKLWSVKATFTPPAQVLCVLRGVSTS
jgi:hypothetical protein